MEQILDNARKKLLITTNLLVENLSSIIASGATPLMLKNVEVECYDAILPLNQVANIKALDATMLLVTPFDKKLNKKIIESINKSNLGINPVDEGGTIRISIPPMTFEKRQLFVKEAKRMGEEARISVRNIRHESIKKAKITLVSEDEHRLLEEKIQVLINDVNKEIEEIVKKKVNSLLKV
ncbi:MAG: ribosome-recycling factor [Candidatus Tyloplasma litorale]|nr:MAG: ribosome-recycling factor [Mycoplasmatales bacterium]